MQKRFAHLFKGPTRDEARLAQIQAIADRNIRRFGLVAEGATHVNKPFAITLDVGSSALPTRPGRGATSARCT
jgi:hypothetical protein